MKKHIFLIIYILIFIVTTSFGIPLRGEHNILELLQIFVLFVGLIQTIRNRKKIIEFYNSYSYNLKIFFFIFLLYEENSYLTFNKSEFFNLNNLQSEINLHNSKYFMMVIIENINIPFLNYSFHLTLHFLLYTLVFALIGYGSFIKKINGFSFMFLERRYSIYTFFYLIDMIIGSIIRNFTSNSVGLVEQEAFELFIYIIFLMDISDKLLKIDILKDKK